MPQDSTTENAQPPCHQPIADLRDPNAVGVIALDFPCAKCGYNLRGLSTDGRCPECGTLVQKAMQSHYIFTWPPDLFPAPKNRLFPKISYVINYTVWLSPIVYFLLFLFNRSGWVAISDNLYKLLSAGFDSGLIIIFASLNIYSIFSFHKIIRIKNLLGNKKWLYVKFYLYISISLAIGLACIINISSRNTFAYFFITFTWIYLLLMHRTINKLTTTIPYCHSKKGIRSIYTELFLVTVMCVLVCFFGKADPLKYFMGILIVADRLNGIFRTCTWYCSYSCHRFNYFMEMTLLGRQDELEKYDSSSYLTYR